MNISTTLSILFFLFGASTILNATSLNQPSTVNIQNETTIVEGSPSFYINGKDICVDENFTVPITVTDFSLITSFQFTIGWDNTLMNFDTISYFYPALGSTFLHHNMSSGENGVLTISWHDINVQGLSLDDFIEIFHIEFTAIAENQTIIDVTFENEPTFKEVTNIVDNEIIIVDAFYNESEINVDQQELDSYEIINDVNNTNVGAVNIDVQNGTTPYEFLWSNDSEFQNLVNVGVGTYMVDVMDAKGCMTTFGPFTVENSTVNINEINSLQLISLFPNPAKDQFHLNAVFENMESLEIAIFNILGEKVYTESRESANLDIDLDISTLSDGNYFLQLITDEGSHTEKLEIVH